MLVQGFQVEMREDHTPLSCLQPTAPLNDSKGMAESYKLTKKKRTGGEPSEDERFQHTWGGWRRGEVSGGGGASTHSGKVQRRVVSGAGGRPKEGVSAPWSLETPGTQGARMEKTTALKQGG